MEIILNKMEQTQVQLDYLASNKVDSNKYYLLNKEYTAIAKKMPSFNASCIELVDADSVRILGEGCSISSKRFVEDNSLVDLVNTSKKQEEEPKEMTLSERLSKMKEHESFAKREEAVAAPTPPTPPSRIDENPPSDKEYEIMLGTYGERVKYIENRGWVLNTLTSDWQKGERTIKRSVVENLSGKAFVISVQNLSGDTPKRTLEQIKEDDAKREAKKIALFVEERKEALKDAEFFFNEKEDTYIKWHVRIKTSDLETLSDDDFSDKIEEAAEEATKKELERLNKENIDKLKTLGFKANDDKLVFIDFDDSFTEEVKLKDAINFDFKEFQQKYNEAKEAHKIKEEKELQEIQDKAKKLYELRIKQVNDIGFSRLDEEEKYIYDDDQDLHTDAGWIDEAIESDDEDVWKNCLKALREKVEEFTAEKEVASLARFKTTEEQKEKLNKAIELKPDNSLEDIVEAIQEDPDQLEVMKEELFKQRTETLNSLGFFYDEEPGYFVHRVTGVCMTTDLHEQMEDGTNELWAEVLKELSLRVQEARLSSSDSKEQSTTVDSSLDGTNFFSKILSAGLKQINISLTLVNDDKFVCLVEPKSQDEAFKNLPPIQLTGKVEDLDAHFFEEINKPLEVASGLFSTADSYIEELNKKEKETLKAKADKDKVKTLSDKAKKLMEEKKWEEAKSTWEEVLSINKNSKSAKTALKKIEEELGKSKQSKLL